jgi:hypothetical protein
MKVRYATEAAPGRPANEDAVFVHGNLVGVLDGVTAPEGLDTGCRHTPAWYVERLSTRLVDASAAQPSAPLTQILGRAIELARHDHGPSCDLTHPGTHSATVALLRERGEIVDYLVLCDIRLVLDCSGDVQVITDQRYADVIAGIRRRAFADAPALGTDDQVARVRQATLERRKLMNRDDGYWIAAADPAAAEHAIVGTAELVGPNALTRAALLTDGAADLVERFAALGWPQLLDLAGAQGPDEVIQAVRRTERQDPHGQAQPRYKRHDDATIAICTFDRSRP